MTTCRGCGQEIKFIRSKTGKYIPCDVRPRPFIRQERGMDSIVTDDGEVIRGQFIEDRAKADGIGYITHFATCPMAHKFRRAK